MQVSWARVPAGSVVKEAKKKKRKKERREVDEDIRGEGGSMVGGEQARALRGAL